MSGKSRRWSDEVELEDDETRSKTNTELLHMRSKEEEKHEQKLDALLLSAQRQKTLAREIGDETSDQVELIEKVTEMVDQQGVRVRNTTKSVERLQVRSSTKCMWIAIVILIIILILVIIAAVQT